MTRLDFNESYLPSPPFIFTTKKRKQGESRNRSLIYHTEKQQNFQISNDSTKSYSNSSYGPYSKQ